MRKLASFRLMSSFRSFPVPWIVLALLLVWVPRGQAADPPLGFTMVISGDPNVPTFELENKSQVEITSLVLTIGQTDKHFDAYHGTTPPPGGTISIVNPTVRSYSFILNISGWDSGEKISFYVDIDGGTIANPSNSIEDYRRVLFNNGSAANAVIQITARDGRTAIFTLPDQPTSTQSSYTLRFGTPRKLTVSSLVEAAASDYVTKVQVKINGEWWRTDANGPVEVGLPVRIDDYITVIDGDTIEIIAPREVYRDINGVDITDSVTQDPNALEDAQERFSATGISVNDVPQTGDPTLFRFDIAKDTVVVVKWQHDYALTMESDFSRTTSPEMAGTNFWAGPLTSEASGNPEPTVQKHWIKKDEPVIAQVDGQVIDFSHPGLDIRHVPSGFIMSRAGQTPVTNAFTVGQSPPQRQQVSEFRMSGPIGVKYLWKIQFGIRVNVDDVSRTALPRVFQISDTQTNVFENEGVFWFDPGTRLWVSAPAEDPNLANKSLAGWNNGDGYYFSSSGALRSDTGELESGGSAPLVESEWLESFDYSSVTYRGLDIKTLKRPARLAWSYGNQQLRIFVNVGEYVFETRPDLAPSFIQQPEQITKRSVTWENKSVGDGDMTIWDPAASKLYPLIAGEFMARWPTVNSTNLVDVIVTVNPPAHYYPHIAGTPAVALDPDPADNFVFKEIKYTENDASVDGNKHFTATTKGKTVLLFGELVQGGRGQPQEYLAVRVVDTKLYTDGLSTSGSAVIGSKITDSTLDRAKLGTGYVMFNEARFNPFIYDANKLEGLAAKDVYDMALLLANSHQKVVTQKDSLPGPIIPVNLHPLAEQTEKIVVVWYDDPTANDLLLWPYRAKVYNPRWPRDASEGLGRIVIASQYGSESQVTNENNLIVDQQVVPAIGDAPAEYTYNPSRLQQVQIYAQDQRGSAGYNPNEEHALMAPSLRYAQVSPRPPAAYALRDNDLNKTFQDATYTSDPYVLVQFLDTADSEFKMRVYQVVKEDRAIPGYRFADPAKLLSSTPPRTLLAEPHITMKAGEPVIPFYPLGVVIGASPCAETFGENLKEQTTFWKDHKDTAWAVSGGENAWFTASFFYPMAPDFWWPPGQSGFTRDVVSGSTVQTAVAMIPQAGDCVSFLPADIQPLLSTPAGNVTTVATRTANEPTRVLFKSDWPDNPAVLKAGETLTFSGGEFRTDNPLRPIIGDDGEIQYVETPGLPGILAFATAEIVFDSLNPLADNAKWRNKQNWTARVAQVLDKRSVPLAFADFPPDLAPATQRTRSKEGKYVFNELPSSLQKRVIYDPLLGRLEMIGLLNDKDIGERTLTASPPAVYILEPNIITEDEETALAALSPDSNWQTAVADLAHLSRNPSSIDSNNATLPGPAAPTYRAQLENFWSDYYEDVGALPAGAVAPPPIPIADTDTDYMVGLEPKVLRDSSGAIVTIEDPVIDGLRRVVTDPKLGVPVRAFGPGLALLPNPNFLDPKGNFPEISWVSVVENNDPSLGGSPITIHIIQVDRRERYRGAIKTVASDNVFDENLVLRHTGDFGANADDLYFEWWYRPDDGSLNVPPPDLIKSGQTNPWKLFPDPTGKRGQGRFQVTLKGNPSAPEALMADSWWFVRYRHANDATQGTDWNVDQTDASGTVVDDRVNFTWAGAGNSDPFRDLDGDGLPDYRAQLAQGWIKRVLDAVNPYEARIRDFDGDNPSTVSSMISQFGARFEGPVALNPSKNVIENVGLIELYETILKRGSDLTINLSRPVSTPAIANALQLASTRISDFYTILGNEAYGDALDPTIGIGSDSVEYGSLAPAVFAFQNQMSSLIEEELSLLRGADYYSARPVYNRLFWNFTKGEGEAAYAMNYNISDVNQDGFIDEDDAMILYPQGHGDAWGHYLTALRNQYDLLKHPYFNWVSRSEFYNLQDIVIKVDFLDERKFAQTAAAKAKAGAEIVNLTYRERYVEDPKAQWQGYTDTLKDRSWGVQGWARRAGQGAYFDWITANALLPSQHPNTNLVGIQKVDRQANSDITVVSANLNAIQQTFDDANKGLNPLGLSGDVVPFDISPALIDDLVFGKTHFEQIYDRAVLALQNVSAIWDNANEARNMLRRVANTEADFRNSVYQEDISFRNRLIQIFGRPYEGTVGPGKLYPAGYEGPDLLLYMYVDVRTIDNSTVPGPAAGFADFDSSGNLSDGDLYDAFVSGQGSGGAPRAQLADFQHPFMPLYLSDAVRRLFAPTFVPDTDGNTSVLARDGLYSVAYTDLDNPKVALENLTQFMPITAAGYTFQAPRDWGTRPVVGELQLHINAMLQQEAQIALAIGAWDGLQGDIVRTVRLINAKLDKAANIRLKNEIFSRTKVIVNNVIKGIEGARAIQKTLGEVVEFTATAGAEFLPKGLPTAGLSISPGDALAPGRGGIEIAATVVKTTLLSAENVLAIAKLASEIALDVAENELDLFEKREDDALAAKEMLVDLENKVGDEPIKRIDIFKEIEALRALSDKFKSMVAEGIRLIDERTAYNKRVAAQTQRNRYQDMTFRVSRNHALQTYRSAFDVAARYSYLAAKAYDYETNLDPSDPGSPASVYNDIVRSRGLGNFDGEPRLGKGGLSEALAWLKVNYDSKKAQLGINNPQYEDGKVSLRTELFRILPKGSTQPSGDGQFPSAGGDSDTLWRQKLLEAQVDDLWMVPEFRYYCRPFAAESDADGNHVPQPGIVLPFSTKIAAGENFFGRPLSGGDHTYDPSHFATKIRSVGVWFSDYLSEDILNDLPASPRVYLVPVGVDVMSISSSDNPSLVRLWHVVDQQIPAPLPARTADLDVGNWIPLLDSLNGRLGEPRKFARFRAYHDGSDAVNTDELVFDSRLIGRSIWNTQWMLIIPGETLNSDPVVGLERFINQVSDIKLVFQSYGYSGQ